VEHVEGADDRPPQPHGEGVDGAEAGVERLRSETRPGAGGRGEVLFA
jgi:hypothetical protein